MLLVLLGRSASSRNRCSRARLCTIAIGNVNGSAVLVSVLHSRVSPWGSLPAANGTAVHHQRMVCLRRRPLLPVALLWVEAREAWRRRRLHLRLHLRLHDRLLQEGWRQVPCWITVDVLHRGCHLRH